MSRQQGSAAENRVARFLVTQGLVLLEQGYQCRFGEIDLIMQDGEQLVFVEVRMRSHSTFGDAFESVDARKQRRLAVTARHYLHCRRLDLPCRFDVVGIDGQRRLEWRRDAFALA